MVLVAAIERFGRSIAGWATVADVRTGLARIRQQGSGKPAPGDTPSR